MWFVRDIQFAVRQLHKNMSSTLITLITLALGIGGTAAIFSVVNSVLLRPLPADSPERIAVIWNVWKGKHGSMAAGDFTDMKRQLEGAETMAAVQAGSFALEYQSTPERIVGQRVTGEFFSTFGVAPEIGRTFSNAEDQPGRDSVAVLSDAMWRSRFQADPNVVGRTVRLDGRVYEVIGVMPPRFGVMPTGFNSAEGQPRLWVPMAFSPQRKTNYDEQHYVVFARLKPGYTFERVQADLQRFAKERAPRFPQENGMRGFGAEPLQEAALAATRLTMYMLLGAALFVLLIACVNVGTLQLARARTRVREFAIRRALGASSGRVAGQLLTESLVLSFFGGLLGLAFASALLRWVVSTAAPNDIPRITEASLDARALVFTSFVIVAAAALSGGWAAVRLRFAPLSDDLRAGGGLATSSARDRLRGALVISEVALSLVLLVCAGLLIHSAMNANRVQLGFQAQNLVAARVDLPVARYADAQRFTSVLHRLEDEAQSLAGVRSAALVDHAPLSGGSSNALVRTDRPFTGEYAVQSALHMITPRYFETSGTRLLAGRNFNDSDRQGAPAVMVISKELADTAFAGEDPIGKQLCFTRGQGITVIGIAENVHHYGVTENAPPEFYIPIDQAPEPAIGWMAGSAELIVRTQGATESIAGEIRSLVNRIEPAAPVYKIEAMKARVAETLEERRFTTTLLTSFAALAVFLAAVGIYGVLSYIVTQRSQEIGIRMALGAQRGSVLRMMVGEGLRLAAIGTVVGVAGSLAVTRLLSSMLYRVAPTDAATFSACALLILGLAALASYIPARRALRVDPVRAIRTE